MSEHSFSVGEKVRVVCDVYKLSRRGMIACHNLDMTYDIIYDSKSEFCKDLLDEEPSVVESRISSLLDFEIDSTAVPSPSPYEMKECGNILFKIHDYDSAVKYYKTSLDTLFPVKLIIVDSHLDLAPSTGSSVLIQNKKTSSAEFHSAIVSDVNEGLYDVIFDDDALGEEESIDISRVILLASVRSCGSIEQCAEGEENSDESAVYLQRSLYMNIARCNMKKNPPQTGWCVRMTSMAIGISRMMLLAHPSYSSSAECEERSVESSSKLSNSLNLKNEESVADGKSSSYSAPANGQKSTNVKKDTFSTKIYNFLSIFFPLTTLRAIFGLLFGALYFYFFGNRVVDIRDRSENNDRIFTDITEEEVNEEVQWIRKQLSDGYYMRCKALLQACRPQLAKQDALALETLNPRKSLKMIKEIEYFLEKRNKSNRKLARDVAEWVDVAVSQSHGHPTANAVDQPYDTELGDLEIENDAEN